MASPAPALTTLKRQLLAAYPGMGAANLGIMADAAHIAGGTSDHIGGNAIDIPVAGGPADMKALALALLADPRAHYAIYDRTFYHEGRAPAPYTGASPHTEHIHLSIYPARREDAAPWAFTEEASGMFITAFPTVGFIGLYRLHRGIDYTLAVTVEQLTAAERADYKCDGVFDLAPGGTVPLHQYVNRTTGYHFYTTGEPPIDWHDDGVLVNVHPVGSGIPVFQSQKDGGHLYSTSQTEGAPDWKLDGPAFGLGVIRSEVPARVLELEKRIAAAKAALE